MSKEQNILKCLQEMDRAYDRGERERCMTLARRILAQRPRNRNALERILSLFVDMRATEDAKNALALLKASFPETGYDCFLESRIDELCGDWEESVRMGERALSRDDLLPWQRSMAHNILGHTYRLLGDPRAAAQHYLASARMRGSSATGDDTLAVQDYSNYLFTIHNLPLSREEMFSRIRAYGMYFSSVKPYAHERRPRHQKLRIGYLSPDLRFHVVAFFSYALLKSYDRHAFTVYAYAANEEDGASREFAQSVDVWRNVRLLSPKEIARQIHEDEIDILFDLSGHTANNCLPVLAYRPAPVQISGIGWFDSTGLPAVDAFLVDAYTDPPGLNEAYFTERLLRLPQSHFCYMWHDRPSAVGAPACLKNGYVTFGCFNNFAKVTEEMLGLWAQILARVPQSRLYLKAGIFNTEDGCARVRARLRRAGIAEERVRFGRQEPEYLDAYHSVDIALDTYPYPGGGTTCDALYMGVPVVTRVGKRHNARFGYSLLMNLGLPELCAASPEAYVEKAVALAEDRERLITYHLTLRRRMRESPVMQDGPYMAELEAGYQALYQDWLFEGRAEERARVRRSWYEKMRDAERREAYGELILYGSRLLTEGWEKTAEESQVRVCRYLVGMAYARQAKQGDTSAKRAVYWLSRTRGRDDREELWRLSFLGEMQASVFDTEGARATFRQAVPLAWRQREQEEELCARLFGRAAGVFLDCGDAAAAFDAYQKELVTATDWRQMLDAYSSLLLTAHYLPLSQAELWALHRGYAELFAGIAPLTPRTLRRSGKLRIGYVSADFRMHVMFPFYFGLFACHDRGQFTVTCYSLSREQDAFTEEVRRRVERFVDISSLSYAEAARVIREDGIDILIDLGGHAGGSGLPILAYRPAPLQISGIGYLDTTGLPAVDALITDDVLDVPETREAFLSERRLVLPCAFCYAGRSDLPASEGTPSAKGRPLVFGVFNHYRKITDEMLAAWRVILERTPGSRLLLKSQELVSDSLVDAAYERLKGIGFDMTRVAFEPATLDYMERYLTVDIALDTYPYPGGGTTFDALYMGVPVVTRYSARRNTRFGLSILRCVGLEQLAADSLEGYIERAVGLARDEELLSALHKSLRSMLRASVAGDPLRYTRLFERKVLALWEEKQQGMEK